MVFQAVAMKQPKRLKVAMLGFGEAGATFAASGLFADRTAAFDSGIPASELKKRMHACRVTHCRSNANATEHADVVLSLVTADQALNAATQTASNIRHNALYLEMNSVAPMTKHEAADAMFAAGAQCLDVAIMAPVNPAKMGVPLLVSGQTAEWGQTVLESLGFTNVRVVGTEIGQAAAIKMIRSVIVKGMEALTAEAVLAGHRAGVLDHVLTSLAPEWKDQADYRLDRMLVHGVRRAAEMEEVAKTLKALSVAPLMTEGTIARQRALGALGLGDVPVSMSEKIKAILDNAGRYV